VCVNTTTGETTPEKREIPQEQVEHNVFKRVHWRKDERRRRKREFTHRRAVEKKATLPHRQIDKKQKHTHAQQAAYRCNRFPKLASTLSLRVLRKFSSTESTSNEERSPNSAGNAERPFLTNDKHYIAGRSTETQRKREQQQQSPGRGRMIVREGDTMFASSSIPQSL
jgi:hypothetical protein